MGNLDESLKDSHDATRTGAGPISETRGTYRLLNSGGTEQRPQDDRAATSEAPDPINPTHYRSHPSGIECIEITRHMNFNTGNAVKYLWRYLDKGDPIENLQKAQWYIDDEIRRLQGLR